MSTDPNLPLVIEAKECKYTLIPKTTTHEEVLQIWRDVSAFISRRLLKKKAVNITGLGVFTVLKRKLDIGNNGKLCVQRPVFVLSEKFAQTHGVTYTKYQLQGEVPVIQLNLAVIATELGVQRSVVEVCVKELIGVFARAVNTHRLGEIAFNDIGKLVVKDNKAKMKFTKDFLRLMDNSNVINLIPISLGRPRTSDSFISQNSVLSTPNFNKSSNLVLPKIERPETWERPPSVVSNQGMSLVLSPIEPSYEDIAEEEEVASDELGGTDEKRVPQTAENKIHVIEAAIDNKVPDNIVSGDTSQDITDQSTPFDAPLGVPPSDAHLDQVPPSDALLDQVPPSDAPLDQVKPSDTRIENTSPFEHLPLVTVDSDDRDDSSMSVRFPVAPCTSSTVDLTSHKRHKTDLQPRRKGRKGKGGDVKEGEKSCVKFVGNTKKELQRSESGCSHKLSGQELCYLCHQRQKRNQPISFVEEKDRYETEQDRVLQQYQELKDQEFYDQENAFLGRERAISKEVAQFNLATSEQQKKVKPAEYHHSYIFNRRVASPPKFLTQEQYSKSLGEQVRAKTERLKRLKDANDKLEQNEQRYLATELSAARRSFLESKSLATQQYQAALGNQVKHKPFRLPKAEPDSDGPVFGRMDMTRGKVSEMRRRAKEVLSHQLMTMHDKKEQNRKEKEENKRYETDMLNKAKQELQQDNYKRYQLCNGIRKELEKSWTNQHKEKMKQDALDRKHQMTAGLLLLDQCDKYSRCKQCERCLDNIGTSNVWRESRYISGFRLMV